MWEEAARQLITDGGPLAIVIAGLVILARIGQPVFLALIASWQAAREAEIAAENDQAQAARDTASALIELRDELRERKSTEATRELATSNLIEAIRLISERTQTQTEGQSALRTEFENARSAMAETAKRNADKLDLVDANVKLVPAETIKKLKPDLAELGAVIAQHTLGLKAPLLEQLEDIAKNQVTRAELELALSEILEAQYLRFLK